MPDHADLLHYPKSLLKSATADLQRVELALSNPKADILALGTSADALGRVRQAITDSRTILREIRDCEEAHELLRTAHAKNGEFFKIQGRLIDRINALGNQPYEQRVTQLLMKHPGLSTGQIQEALNQQSTDIDKARASWKLALGSPAAFVWPEYLCWEKLSSVLKALRQHRHIRRRFILFGAWYATPSPTLKPAKL